MNIKKLLLAFGFAMLVASPIAVSLVPVTANAVSSDPDCEVRVFGIPPWYRGLAIRDGGTECAIAGPGTVLNGKDLDLSGFIWRIVMNVIEIALFVVGYISLFFVLYGGFQYLVGGDNASKIESAKKTILNALIGLGISIGSVVVVNLIFGIIG